MSSAEPTESVEAVPPTEEATVEVSEAPNDPLPTEPASDTPETGHASAWRRLSARVPIELPILTLLAALTRFVSIYSPKAIVFDEVYFREYALHYKAGTYYFDLHPPLGKLLLGLWAGIAGTDATATNKDPAVVMRLLPAFMGVLLIIAVYYFIRELSNSRRIATLGAALILLDNAILVESRFILMDSMLLLFGMTAVTLALAARKRTGRAYWGFFLGAVAFGGLAISIKLTGVSAMGLVGVLWLVELWERRAKLKVEWRRVAAQVAAFALIPLAIYTTTFVVHFALLPKTGPGDAYMTQEFQATLKGNPNYNADAHRSAFQKFGDLNRAIHQYELSLNSSKHPYQSKWTSWPIMKRGVYIYVEGSGNGKTKYIYTLGNPFVWWGTLLGVLLTAIGWIARPKRFRPYMWALIFCGLGWAVNFLPFAFITRPMFLYHYFYALIFSLSFAVIGLGALTGWIEDRGKPFSFPSRRSAAGYWAILGVATLTFLFFLPITYGLPLTQDGLDHRMWLSSWR